MPDSLKPFLVNTYKQVNNMLCRYFPGIMKKFEFGYIDKLKRNKAALDIIEEPEMLFINDLIPAGATVLDIGANIGTYSYIFEKANKYKQIYAFEPFPALNARLRNLFPNIHVENLAVSDTNTVRKLNVPYIKNYLYITRASLEDNVETGQTDRIESQVQTVTLDQFVLQRQIKDLKLIKIDVEGHEWAALKGAQKTLEQYRPVLMVEIEQRHHDFPVNKIFDFILNLGYAGYFFEAKTLTFKPISQFDTVEHQLNKQIKKSFYVNNLLFFPADDHTVAATFARIENEFRNNI